MVLEQLAAMFKKNPFGIGSSDVNSLKFCNEFIFCFNDGNLVRRILLDSDHGVDPEAIKDRLVAFYSFRMFLVHYESLGSQTALKEQLKELFLETHSYESLEHFLGYEKHSVTQSLLKAGVRGGMEEVAPQVSKSVVLTRSRGAFASQSAVEFLVSDVEDTGSLELKRMFNEAMDQPNTLFVILRFDKPDTAKHFNFLKSQVDNWLSERANEGKELESKSVCLVVQDAPKAEAHQVEFSVSKWKYVVIENLDRVSYHTNLQYVDLNTFEITQKLQREVDMFSMAQIFLKTFDQIGFQSHLGRLIAGKVKPTLMAVKKHDEEPANFFLEMLRDFYQAQEQTPSFQNLPDWRQEVFSQAPVSGGDAVSIESLVQKVFSNLLQKNLKKLFVKLHKQKVDGSLFSFEKHRRKVPVELTQFFREELKKVMADPR